jgi:hypothetical protein
MSTTSTVVAPPVSGPPGQPDISYVPDPAKWRARAEQRIRAGGLPKTVPAGFPEQLTGDLVWDGRSIAETYNWTFVLSDVFLGEIDRAVKHFQCEFASCDFARLLVDRIQRLACPSDTSAPKHSRSRRYVLSSAVSPPSFIRAMVSLSSAVCVSMSIRGRRTSSSTLAYPRTLRHSWVVRTTNSTASRPTWSWHT